MKLRLAGLFGALAVATIVGGCSSAIPGTPLDSEKAETQLAQAIEDQVGTEVTVTCPDEIELKPGEEATCSVADSSGGAGNVSIRLKDGDGNLLWALDDDNTLAQTNLNMTEVIDSITADLKADGIAATVECPDTVPIDAKASFKCTATTSAGETTTVKVTQTDDKGNFTTKVK